jgi:hypothetical protein
MSESAPAQVSPAAVAVDASDDAKRPRVDRIEMTLPDDWHMHFRDDERLPIVSNLASKQFGRAIAMPNLIPPVVNTEQALAYRLVSCFFHLLNRRLLIHQSHRL